MVQGEALNTLRDHEGPRIIIHPIKGDIARLTCRDCGKQINCPNCNFVLSANGTQSSCRRCGYKGDLPLECPSCGGPDLGKSLPGIERLKSAWKKQESDIEVEWRGVSNADFEQLIPEQACVLLTDASLISGGAEDVRRLEKLAVTFRRLARDVEAAHGVLIVQTEEHMAEFWTQVLSTEGFQEFRLRERASRQMFQYPPAKRLIKVIVESEDERPLASIKKLAEVRGPYPVAYRVKSRKNRYIWHVIPKTNSVSRELHDALAVLSRQALIDLDPIAFLR
jgi:primosomal protein N' (replication factor Y)